MILGKGSTDEMTGVIIGGVTANAQDEGLMWLTVLGHDLDIEHKGQDLCR